MSNCQKGLAPIKRQFFDQSIIKFDEKMSQARDRLKKKTFSISSNRKKPIFPFFIILLR